MKPAHDEAVDYKALVRAGYELCAQAYEDARRAEEQSELALLSDRLPPQAAVLDIGCGSGLPITGALARQALVTGVDTSAEMVRRARLNVPEARFIQADIMALEFSPNSFDAVVAFYSIFHLPREEHPRLLRRLHAWLKPSGYLLATFSRYAEQGYTEDDFFGARMYWSNYSLEQYQHTLQEIGFTLLDTITIGHGYQACTYHPEEDHPLVFAQKID